MLLVPLLAAATDQARAALSCGPHARTCLEAAGQVGPGGAGLLALLAYAVCGGLIVARLARLPRGRGALDGGALGAAAVSAVVGGQAALVAAAGHGAVLGDGWLSLPAL